MIILKKNNLKEQKEIFKINKYYFLNCYSSFKKYDNMKNRILNLKKY